MTAFDWLQSLRSPLRRVGRIRKPRARRGVRHSTGLAAAIDVLEDRTLLASITVDGGHVTIEGTEGDDNIWIGGGAEGPSSNDNRTTLTLDSYDTNIERTVINLKSITINLKGGNDFLHNRLVVLQNVLMRADGITPVLDENGHTIYWTVNVAVEIFGGAGSDDIWCIGPNVFIDGGTNDVTPDRIYLNYEGDDYYDNALSFHLSDTSARVPWPDAPGLSFFDVRYQNVEVAVFSGTTGDDTVTTADGTGIAIHWQGFGGMDNVTGGDGDDIFYGGSEKDIFDGGKGNDYISPGGGDDLVLGGEGDDDLRGDDGADVLDGGEGDDELYGDQGTDTLTGGPGNDFLAPNFSGEPDPQLNEVDGGEGDDRIEWELGTGISGLSGGSGADQLTFSGAPGEFTLLGSEGGLQITAGSSVLAFGFEALRLFLYERDWDEEGENQTVLIDNPVGVGYLQIRTRGGHDDIEVRAADVAAGEAQVRVDTGFGDDHVRLDGPNFVGGLLEVDIRTGESNDTIEAYIRNPSTGPIYMDLNAGEGLNDSLHLFGSDQTEDFYLTQIEDSPVNPDDEIEPGGYLPDYEALADELLTAEVPQDVRDFGNFYVHSGQAMLEVNMHPEQKLEIFEISAGNGGGRIQGRLDQFDDGVTLDTFLVNGGDGADVLDMSAIAAAAVPAILKLNGGNADDQLYGRDANDELIGGAGDDIVVGNGGDDVITGETGKDFLIGDGLDLPEQALAMLPLIDRRLLDASRSALTSAATLQGSGIDTISGGDGDDFIMGGDGKDELIGGLGDDTLVGNGGDDTLNGEAGKDFLVGDGFDLSEQGWATLRLIASSLLDGGQNMLELSLNPQGSGVDTISGGDGDDFIIGGDANDFIEAGAGNALIYGDEITAAPIISVSNFWSDPLVVLDLATQEGTLSGQGDDIITGSLVDSNVIIGGSGVDTITGANTTGKWDFLFGNDGRDSLRGQDGNNIIIGGSNPADEEKETLNGGKDFDLIVGDRFTFATKADFDLSKLVGEEPELAVKLTAGFALTGSGGDAVHAGDGVNVVFGGAGDDHITGGNGALDALFGNGGEDRIGGLNKTNIIFGGDGSDPALLGGEDADLILGDDLTVSATLSFDLTQLLAGEVPVSFAAALQNAGTGNDTIDTGGGFNFVWGGAGNDTVDGRDGALDILFGNDGADTIRAGNGTNLIVGGDGNDPELKGGEGADLILGDGLTISASLSFDLPQLLAGEVPVTFAAAVQDAGTGDDTIGTGGGVNFVWGGAGNDTIDGGDGALDILFGNDGRDTIRAANGTNLIVGGHDDDPELKGGEGVDVILGDSLEFKRDEENNPEEIELPKESADSVTTFFRQSVGLFTAVGLAGAGMDDIEAGNGFNFVLGGAGDDTIRGGNSWDVLYGHGGEDKIFGGDGTGIDLIVGGHDNDILAGHRSTASFADDGPNIIFGDNVTLDIDFNPGFLVGEKSWPSLDAGLMLTGSGSDDIYGGDDFDFLVGGDGEDDLYGRDGFNIAFGDDFSQATALVDFAAALVNPFEGIELVGKELYEFAKDLVYDSIYEFFFGSEENPDDQKDFYQGGSGVDLVFGGGGKDTLKGGAGFDVLVGGGDDDEVDVGPKESVIHYEWDSFGFGGPGNDLIIGGNGNDILGSTFGDDIVRGGGGNDVIVGGEQSDQLYGEEGDDSLFGQAGNDLLVGGPGSDLLSGGSGDDIYEFDAGDEIVDDDGGIQPASVIDVIVNGGNANRSGIRELTFTFSNPVTIDAATSLKLFNHTTGQAADLIAAALVNNGTTYVAWDLTGVMLPDGRYTAELPKTGTSPNLAQTFTTEFHVLKGDLSGDGVVNLDDFSIFGANFSTSGAPYKAGDVDGDGAVNLDDFSAFGASFSHSLAALQYDFGDAPDAAMLPTILANNGARHVISGNSLFLGTTRDAETNGQSSADAAGDGADDDGVSVGDLVVGATVGITITAEVPATAALNAWIDFNRDGDWDDAGEQVFVDQPIVNGANGLSVTVPSEASLGTTFARFRLTQTGGYSYFGLAASGEVEDYELNITAPSLELAALSGESSAESPDATSTPLLLQPFSERTLQTFAGLSFGRSLASILFARANVPTNLSLFTSSAPAALTTATTLTRTDPKDDPPPPLSAATAVVPTPRRRPGVRLEYWSKHDR